MNPYFEDDAVRLYLGDCLDVLATLPDASVDAVICDPPYGLAHHPPAAIAQVLARWLAGDRAHVPAGAGFMGKDWDAFVPPPAVWDQCARVLKPGGHLIAFAGARTADLMTLSIRLAGFEIRDGLTWIHGSGMPKGQDIAKSIDRHRDDRSQVLQVTTWLADARDTAGWTNKRIDALFGFHGMASHWTSKKTQPAVPTLPQWDVLREAMGFDDTKILPLVEELNSRVGSLGEAWSQREVTGQAHRVRRASDVQNAPLSAGTYNITAPASDAARQWQGWNTQLKPAHEPIVLARKPTGNNSTVSNVMEHGTGALNIDACRIPMSATDAAIINAIHAGMDPATYQRSPGASLNLSVNPMPLQAAHAHEGGRWPTNALLTHPPLLDADGQVIGDACADGCVPGCPVAELDRQSGCHAAGARTGARSGKDSGTFNAFQGQASARKDIGDSGGASRFFPAFRYQAKAPSGERPRLADGTAWPTVKPLALMRWLVRLITPPGGVIVDPFAGTGTTLEAAAAEGFTAIGIEREKDGADLCVQRMTRPPAGAAHSNHRPAGAQPATPAWEQRALPGHGPANPGSGPGGEQS